MEKSQRTGKKLCTLPGEHFGGVCSKKKVAGRCKMGKTSLLVFFSVWVCEERNQRGKVPL